MNDKNQFDLRRATPSTSEPDDGWWQSLMAEEIKYAPAAKARAGAGRKPGRHPDAAKERKAPGMDWVDWTRVLEIQEAESVCYAEVVGFNRGGLLVRTQEFQGFVPRSHLAAAVNGQRITERLLEGYLGREIELKVIECDPERGRIVLSERAAQTAPGSRQTLLQTLQIDQELDGVVTNVTPFGLFIDLGGVEGLVHISELSWGRVGHPREIANPGDKVKVVVLHLEMDRGRVSLSIKRGQPNPWETALERYPRGAEIEAEITEVVHFGAFAKLEEGLEGLIHISQMGLHERLDPRLVLEPGIKVQVSVLQVEPQRQRLSLQLLSQPWKDKDNQGPNWLDTPGEHG
ncbi:MAG TPA: S1 RNA-binding domain-containing protein [Anaerolineales bacterium]|nr:S1 RNA-binding domain-containing protein [Anaerolineales bacterium]